MESRFSAYYTSDSLYVHAVDTAAQSSLGAQVERILKALNESERIDIKGFTQIIQAKNRNQYWQEHHSFITPYESWEDEFEIFSRYCRTMQFILPTHKTYKSLGRIDIKSMFDQAEMDGRVIFEKRTVYATFDKGKFTMFIGADMYDDELRDISSDSSFEGPRYIRISTDHPEIIAPLAYYLSHGALPEDMAPLRLPGYDWQPKQPQPEEGTLSPAPKNKKGTRKPKAKKESDEGGATGGSVKNLAVCGV